MVEVPSSSSALSFPFFPALLVVRMSLFTLIHISWGVTIFTVTQKKAELKSTLRIVLYLYLFWTHLLIEFMSLTSRLWFLLQQKAGKMKGMPCLGANSPERELTLLDTDTGLERNWHICCTRKTCLRCSETYYIPPKAYSLLWIPKVIIYEERLSIIFQILPSLRSPLIGAFETQFLQCWGIISCYF